MRLCRLRLPVPSRQRSVALSATQRSVHYREVKKADTSSASNRATGRSTRPRTSQPLWITSITWMCGPATEGSICRVSMQAQQGWSNSMTETEEKRKECKRTVRKSDGVRVEATLVCCPWQINTENTWEESQQHYQEISKTQ